MSLDTVVNRLNGRRARAGRFMAKCPAHPDRLPSLSIASGRDGRVLLHCWAGCATDDVLSAAGLTIQDLFAGARPTRAQAAAAERSRVAAEARRLKRLRGEREYIRALREGYRERTDFLARVAPKVALMAEGDPGAAVMTELFHDAVAEVRSYDRAIVDDSDDFLPMERAVPLKPKWMA